MRQLCVLANLHHVQKIEHLVQSITLSILDTFGVGCGVIFNDSFIVCFPENLIVEEF